MFYKNKFPTVDVLQIRLHLRLNLIKYYYNKFTLDILSFKV